MGILEKTLKIMNIDTLQSIVAIILSILAFFGTPVAFIIGRRQRRADTRKTETEADQYISEARKLDAETLQTIVNVYGITIKQLRESIEELHEDRDADNAEIFKLKESVGELKQTNAILLARTATLEKQNTEKDIRIKELERQNTEKDVRIQQMQDHISKLEVKQRAMYED